MGPRLEVLSRLQLLGTVPPYSNAAPSAYRRLGAPQILTI